MRILLTLGLAFESRTDDFGGVEDDVIGDVGSRALAAVASIDKLHGSDTGAKGERGELEQAVGGLDLDVRQPHAIGLERAEGLLDTPYTLPLIIKN